MSDLSRLSPEELVEVERRLRGGAAMRTEGHPMRVLLTDAADAVAELVRRVATLQDALRPYLTQHNLADRDRHCVCSYCNVARDTLRDVSVSVKEELRFGSEAPNE